jgi:heme oxygenase
VSAGEASGLETPGPVAAAALITTPPHEALKRFLEHLEPLEHQAEDRERAARQAAKNADAYARQVREIRAYLKRQGAKDDAGARIGDGGASIKAGLRDILRNQARESRQAAARLRERRAMILRKMVEEVVSTVSEDISKRFLRVVNDYQAWNAELEWFHQQHGGGDAPPRIRLNVQ